MDYDDFIKLFWEDVEGFQSDEIDCLTNDNLNRKRNFNFSGIYILCDGDEVVYVGSAYARSIHDRLLQYTHDPNTDSGNTLVKDIMDIKEMSKHEAIEYIKTLKVYAFENKSLEYRMIEELHKHEGMIFNNAGTHKKEEGKSDEKQQ